MFSCCELILDIVHAGYQFDYVFDWTVLKYPQIGGSSRGRVSAFISCLFGTFFFCLLLVTGLLLVVITAWHWQGSNECGSTSTKTRKDLRSVFFQLNKIMKFGMGLTLGGQEL